MLTTGKTTMIIEGREPTAVQKQTTLFGRAATNQQQNKIKTAARDVAEMEARRASRVKQVKAAATAKTADNGEEAVCDNFLNHLSPFEE
jgi:thymidine kinase